MPRILIVEDNESLRLLIEVVLEQQGYTVMAAANGAVAYDLMRQGEKFDAVVTDIYMPEMDGIRLLSLLRRQFPSVPVVIASAYLYQIQHALALGASQHLLKPFTNRQLVEAVCSVIPQTASAAV